MPTSGSGLPRIYFRKGGVGAFSASTQCSFASGSNYNCTINYSLLPGGGSTGDTIEYYVAAQDNAGNVWVDQAPGAAGFTAGPPAVSHASDVAEQLSYRRELERHSERWWENFTSLTRNDAGGIFRYINTNIVTGNITRYHFRSDERERCRRT